MLFFIGANYSFFEFSFFLIFSALFSVDLFLGVAGLRDFLGTCCYSTNRGKRAGIFLAISALLFLSLFFILDLKNSLLTYFEGAVLFVALFFLLQFSFYSIFSLLTTKTVGKASLTFICFLLTFIFSILLANTSGEVAAIFKLNFTIVVQYQEKDWAVVFETPEKFYLAPVEIDCENDHLQFLSEPGQIVSNENLLLTQETFTKISPPEAS